MVNGHPLIDTQTPPNWYTDTPQLIRRHPPLIKFSSFLIKLEYHVNLSCLHLHQHATVARPYPEYHLAFTLPPPWLSTHPLRRCTTFRSLQLIISTSLQKAKAMRLQLSNLKPTSRHHRLYKRHGFGVPKAAPILTPPERALLALAWQNVFLRLH